MFSRMNLLHGVGWIPSKIQLWWWWRRMDDNFKICIKETDDKHVS
jgi:hypothetical protein